MSALDFVETLPPWADGQSAIPAPFVAEWARTSHGDGATRRRALAEVQRRLGEIGFAGCALVSGPWLQGDARIEGVDVVDPFPTQAPEADRMQAEIAGIVDADWLRERVEAFLEDEARAQPSETPRAFRCDTDPPCLLVDFSVGGRRAALALFVAPSGAQPLVDWLVAHPASWWVYLGFGGLLRVDGYWSHWDRVVELLLSQRAAADTEGQPQPVNAQEVTLSVADQAARWATDAARAFDVATVGIFVVDPDDEYVWCLGAHGTERYAYDSGLIRRKPEVGGVGYGLTAAWACAPAVDPRGRPVVVRDLSDRAALNERYLDLGFDEAALRDPGPQGPFLAERFTDPAWLEAVRRGPWVFTAQRLPRALSPTGHNLVVRYCGRTTHPRWSTALEQSRSSVDRRARQAALAIRIQEDVVRGFREGLAQWRDGLREEVLRELSGPRRLDALCRTIAAWCSARAITLWDLDGRTLRLSAWSRPEAPEHLTLDTAERLDARELRLLHAPTYPRRHEVGSDGFLGWSPLEDALGGPAENVGTVPVTRDGRAVGLLRIDGAMSLFAGHIPRSSPQAALHRHRPMRTPAHVRPVVEEVVRLLALASPRPAEPTTAAGWSRFVQQAAAGGIGPAEARARLASLHTEAPTRAAAAARLGVHRNTFRRHLKRLQEVLGTDAVPW